MTDVRQFVDQVLDEARSAHPGVEFGITLSLANALLLPKGADKLWRPDADGRVGYYSGDVYRDCLVDEIPNTEPAPIDYLVIVSPVYGTSDAAGEPTHQPSPPDTSYRRLLVGGPVARTYSGPGAFGCELHPVLGEVADELSLFRVGIVGHRSEEPAAADLDESDDGDTAVAVEHVPGAGLGGCLHLRHGGPVLHHEPHCTTCRRHRRPRPRSWGVRAVLLE